MTAHPRISVVIALYNKRAYVEEAIASVLRSEYPVHEVIVVDDGSTDDGPQQVLAMGQTRVRLLTQANRGVSAARNRGIREATGDHIAFLDADDLWAPSYLPAIVELITRFPDCGLYATHFYFFRDDGLRQVPRLWGIRAGSGAQQIERFFEIWSHAVFFCTCSVVIPTRILRDLASWFPEGEQHGEDQDLWFRIAERWPMAQLPQPLVGYRIGVSASLMTSHPNDFPPCIRRLAARYRAHEIPRRHRRGVARLLCVSRLLLARTLLLSGLHRRAIKLVYHQSCLRAPRLWLRMFLAAHLPAAIRGRLLP